MPRLSRSGAPFLVLYVFTLAYAGLGALVGFAIDLARAPKVPALTA